MRAGNKGLDLVKTNLNVERTERISIEYFWSFLSGECLYAT